MEQAHRIWSFARGPFKRHGGLIIQSSIFSLVISTNMRITFFLLISILLLTSFANAEEKPNNIAKKQRPVEVTASVQSLKKEFDSIAKSGFSKFEGCTVPPGILVGEDDFNTSMLSKQLELEAGDVLVELDGKKLESAGELTSLLENLKKKKSSKLLIHRRCKNLELSYTYNRKNLGDSPPIGEKTKIDMSLIAGSAKVSPNFQNGEQKGLRLSKIKDRSIYANIGFKDKDAVLALNDKQINDRGLWYSFLSQIAEKEKVTFSIERAGEIRKINLSKKDIRKVVNDSLKVEGSLSYSVDKGRIKREVNDIPRLLAQARAVPFFRNGQTIGYRFFAIINGGIHQAMGLKEGDILLGVDGEKVSSSQQALKLPLLIYKNDKVILSVERAGALVEIVVKQI